MLDRRSLIVIATCMVLLFTWPLLMQKLGFLPVPVAPGAASGAAAVETPVVADLPVAGTTSDNPAPAVTPGTVPMVVETPVGPVAPPRVELSVPGVSTFTIDTARGGIATMELLQYLEDSRNGHVILGRDDLPWGALAFAKPEWRLGPAALVQQDPSNLILERLVTGVPGLRLRQEWHLRPDRPYELAYGVTLTNGGELPVRLPALTLKAGAAGLAGERSAAKQWNLLPEWRRKLARWFGLSVADTRVDVFRREKNSPETFAVHQAAAASKSGKEHDRLAETAVTWVAAHNKYFATYLAVSDTGSKAMFTGFALSEAKIGADQEQWVVADAFLEGGNLEPGARWTRTFAAYAGPKEYQNLRLIGNGVESILQMDLFFFFHPQWMGALSRGILHAIIGIKNWLAAPWGYGLAIILITLFFKLLFWPLTHYSTVSMKKLQKLQPLIAAAREKFKDDPRRLQERTMEIYRENKVNPLGGCLPMLLQIPVFFALYNVLRCAIELRQANFLWIHDLSLPDTLPWEPLGIPLRPLGALAGITMIIQQRITPNAMEPTQARIMLFMMVFFSLIFYAMPSGLTLYWSVNTTISIIQMTITYRIVRELHPDTPAPRVATSPKK